MLGDGWIYDDERDGSEGDSSSMPEVSFCYWAALLQINANLITGHETTANTLTKPLWLLSMNQQVQEEFPFSVMIKGSKSKYLSSCIKYHV